MIVPAPRLTNAGAAAYVSRVRAMLLSAIISSILSMSALRRGTTAPIPALLTSIVFAAGPQLAYRHFSHITPFVRPSIGAIHEVATPHPTNAIAAGIAKQLVPSGQKTDWTGFYGFGGGVDLLFSRHVGLRVQADLVYDHLFSDLLKDGRLTTRFSIGPCFNFGKNIAR